MPSFKQFFTSQLIVVKRLFLVFFLLSANSFGADAPTAEKTAAAARAALPPIIDGQLDEAAWADAAIIEDLHQVKPEEYDQPSERTQVLLMYDADYLYVGVRAFDSEPDKITAKVLRQGGSLRDDDRVKILLSPFNDNRSGYSFLVNSNGVRIEGIYKGNDFDGNWNGIWIAESSLTDYGWAAEVAIPFKTLSFVSDEDWGFNFSREVVRKQEEMGWDSRNRNINPSVVGTLTGLTGLSQGVGLDVVPALSVTNNRNYGTGKDTSDFEPSLDVFYRLTPSLNASLTLNTDFSATEVDNRQVNLTRFNLFFPEKRDFFLRESDIFEFGGIGGDDKPGITSRADRESGRPYFSRRIGLGSNGQPVDLDVGAKISGRIGRWNIGTQVIHQADYEGFDSCQDDFVNIEATDIFVGRVSANIFEESTAGFIVTDGDPRSNCDSTLAGFDFLYRNSRLSNNRQLSANIWYQQSDTEGKSGNDTAFGIGIESPNQTGWRGGAAMKEIQQNFFPAVGFISRAGIQQFSADAGYTWRPNGERIRSISSSIDAQRIDLIDGGLQSQAVFLKAFEVRNNGNDRIALGYKMEKENLLEPFEISDGVFIPAGEYSFDSTEITFESSKHRPFNIGLEYEFGEFFDGDIKSIESEFGWRPSKHFQASIAYTVADVDLPGDSFTTRLASASFDIVFSNTVSWVNLIQYDNVSESIGLNSRLHWVPQAGRNVFLVLNHNYRRCVDEVGVIDCMNDTSFHSTTTDLTLKADYTFRF